MYVNSTKGRHFCFLADNGYMKAPQPYVTYMLPVLFAEKNILHFQTSKIKNNMFFFQNSFAM
jgi:hypothetical protein